MGYMGILKATFWLLKGDSMGSGPLKALKHGYCRGYVGIILCGSGFKVYA